ncbi:hypothetical protein MPTK1_3g10190 [Marchantia polymorpha subsp. ruderalis]|uniref:WAP domain-containing protein n=2 Tax=Marchantia polymorpha TaxID=3197 RepID=A0AAF6AZA5_MARPO|nr:hypothetical protein MARPO_0085s0008 [Marchantia polymorpha]BBN05089.1 hypothetical protein Mp_3g10190 [Marchantia polymorpha subsp. ruderalis]|eukprot:PTQ33784.1 hypothetical protein MARPO_0085s0008 [Marchantia polymorpha]
MNHKSLLFRFPLTFLLVLSIVISASGRGLTDVSGASTGRTLPPPADTRDCHAKYHVLECGCTNNTQCCNSAKPCFTPLGCKPGDCVAKASPSEIGLKFFLQIISSNKIS